MGQAPSSPAPQTGSVSLTCAPGGQDPNGPILDVAYARFNLTSTLTASPIAGQQSGYKDVTGAFSISDPSLDRAQARSPWRIDYVASMVATNARPAEIYVSQSVLSSTAKPAFTFDIGKLGPVTWVGQPSQPANLELNRVRVNVTFTTGAANAPTTGSINYDCLSRRPGGGVDVSLSKAVIAEKVS